MKNFIYIFLSLLTLAFTGYCWINLSGKFALVAMFACGFLLAVFLMNLSLNVKNAKINSYKRELEKESVKSLDNSSRVKVLEQKIEVLEKALENALNK